MLGRPERHFQAIHIGGTNGKGSVAALVYSALRQTGIRTALYQSPHLVDVRERMIVDDSPISPGAFAAWTERLRNTIEETDASFFEATTAIAFTDFAARGADLAVVEVGLGGRLDATNVVDPLVSAVTSVNLEHTDYLGTSLEGIAREKAGIAKAGIPFVVGEADSALAEVLVERAGELGATPVEVPSDAAYEGVLSLAGEHQRRNAAVAEAVLAHMPEECRPDATAIARGFRSAWLPGRFDRRGIWLFDVAHNPSATAALIATMRRSRLARPVHALVGLLRDKDWRTVLHMLRSEVNHLWFSVAPSAPAHRRPDLAEVAAHAHADVVVEPDFDRAFASVQRGASTVLVTGSFHTVGDVMVRLPGFPPLG